MTGLTGVGPADAAAGTAALAAGAPAGGAAAVISARLAHPQQLVGTSWRAQLASALAALPQFHAKRTVEGALSGQVIAGVLQLPAVVALSGDTTILAGTLTFASARPEIITHGHPLTILAVNAVRTAAPGSGPDASPIATVTINSSGQPGNNGQTGAAGTAGKPGDNGITGGTDYACDGEAGTIGTNGFPGSAGFPGGQGSPGGPAGNITLDIPSGSTNAYVLIADGGPGGAGGTGGAGGAGGSGGNGGNGGDAYFYDCNPGDGGNAGNGADGGDGNIGGTGANGGNGGIITVTYPSSYNPSMIAAQALGGPGGPGGSGGVGGAGGMAGKGGAGGMNTAWDCLNCEGLTGDDGAPGAPGQPPVPFTSASGAAGANGSVTVEP